MMCFAAGLIVADSINMLLRIAFSLAYVRILCDGAAAVRLTAFVPSRSTLAALSAAFVITGRFVSCGGLCSSSLADMPRDRLAVKLLCMCLCNSWRHQICTVCAGCSAAVTLGPIAGGPAAFGLALWPAGSGVLRHFAGSSFPVRAAGHVSVGAACLVAVLLTVRRCEGRLWAELSALRRDARPTGPAGKTA